MGPTLKAQQKKLARVSCGLACIPVKAQQQIGAQALYGKAGQNSAGLLIAGKFGAHPRQSMNHTRRGMNMFRRDFGVLTTLALLTPINQTDSGLVFVQVNLEQLQGERDEMEKEFEEIKRQLEEDTDKEIEEMKER